VPAHVPTEVALVQLDPDLSLPAYARDGDAGLDLLAREDGVVAACGGRLLMPTGIAIAIPPGRCGYVVPRSGLALKHGVTVANAPGLIDAGYRGEIKVILVNTDPATDYAVHRGDRIAQLVISRFETVAWSVVAELDGRDRGGGFGHSGR
jgi:dUTP pyrophosphatase